MQVVTSRTFKLDAASRLFLVLNLYGEDAGAGLWQELEQAGVNRRFDRLVIMGRVAPRIDTEASTLYRLFGHHAWMTIGAEEVEFIAKIQSGARRWQAALWRGCADRLCSRGALCISVDVDDCAPVVFVAGDVPFKKTWRSHLYSLRKGDVSAVQTATTHGARSRAVLTSPEAVVDGVAQVFSALPGSLPVVGNVQYLGLNAPGVGRQVLSVADFLRAYPLCA